MVWIAVSRQPSARVAVGRGRTEGAPMGIATEAGPTQGTVGAAEGSGASTILLVEATSEVERTLIAQWARESGLEPAQVLPLHAPALTRPLAEADGATVVTAARVAWLPRERNGVRRV